MQSSITNSPHSPSIPFLFSHPHALFAIPAGCYRAVLRDVSKDESEIDEGKLVLRFLFDIVAGTDGPVNYSAALKYSGDKEGHAKLNRDTVAPWAPEEVDQMQGIPVESDLVEYVGSQVDLMIATFISSDRPAYSRVTGIYPAGDLITDEMMSMGNDRVAVRHRSRRLFYMN